MDDHTRTIKGGSSLEVLYSNEDMAVNPSENYALAMALLLLPIIKMDLCSMSTSPKSETAIGAVHHALYPSVCPYRFEELRVFTAPLNGRPDVGDIL